MFKKLKKFIRNHELLSVFLLLLIIVLISYGKTINMYWWVDDWGLLFKMVHPNAAPGNLGAGVWGEGAYVFLATPFIFLYHLFGVDARPYFILGLFQYFIASFVVYLFIRELTNNKLISLGVGVIFASGYIGSYALYRLSNSYQLSDTVILVYLSGYLLLRYLKCVGKNYYVNYLFSLVSYSAAIYLMFLRAHGIVVVVGSVFVFYVIKNWKIEKKILFRRIVEILPFFLIYLYFYFIRAINGPLSRGISSRYLQDLIKEIFINKNFSLLDNLSYTFSSAIVPSPWIYFIFSFFKRRFAWIAGNYLNGDFLVSWSGYLLFSLSVLLPIVWKKYRKYLIYLPLASLFILGNVFTYFGYMPTSGLDSIHRYIMPAFTGGALFCSLIFLVFSDKLKRTFSFLNNSLFYLLLFLLSISLIRLSYESQESILKYISYPTRNAYKVIKSVVPKVDENTSFFIEAEDDPRVKNNVLSGMGYLGISILYNYDGITSIIDGYDALYSGIIDGKIKLDGLYTFFASDKLGFVHTSKGFKNELYRKLPPKKITGWDYSNSQYYIKADFNYSSLMPTELSLVLSFTPEKPMGKTIPIQVGWLNGRMGEYRPYYIKGINIVPDGQPYKYVVVLPPGGITMRGVRVDGYRGLGEIKVFDSSIVNLTLPEINRRNLLYNNEW